MHKHMPHAFNGIPINIRMTISKIFRKHIHGFSYNLYMFHEAKKQNRIIPYIFIRITASICLNDINGIKDMLKRPLSLIFSLIYQDFIMVDTFPCKRQEAIILDNIHFPF